LTRIVTEHDVTNAVTAPPDTDTHIAQRIAIDGWCVLPLFLPEPLVATVRTEALAHWQEGCYHLARVGRGNGAAHRPNLRCDQVMWFEPPFSLAQTDFLGRMESLRRTINLETGLGLFDFECHFTRYAPGTFYTRHLDRFRDDSRRTVSVIVYLNDSWREQDGGALRIYLDGERAPHDIEPIGGSLVCFRSDRFWHEVLPTGRERLSLTGWFRTRG